MCTQSAQHSAALSLGLKENSGIPILPLFKFGGFFVLVWLASTYFDFLKHYVRYNLS